MKAGFGRREITPDRSMKMAGFDRRKDPSQGTLDALEVCVLALADAEQTPFLLCALDLLGTDSTLCTQIRQAVATRLGIAPERVWVSATHTHSAPTGHFSGNTSYDECYVNFLIQQAVAAAEEAWETMRPATPAVAQTHATGVASLRNRGRSGSEFPMPFPLVFLENPEQNLAFSRICCHPTVLDERNLLYSRDLPGQLRDGVAQERPMLVLNGPCADLSTRFTRQNSTAEELQRLGKILTEAAQAAQPQKAPHFGQQIRAFEKVLYLSRSASLSGELR